MEFFLNKHSKLQSELNQTETFQSEFCPTAEEIRKITTKGLALLENASDQDLEKLGHFSE